MPDRSSRPQARHFGPALVVLASLGIAEAAPPAGKPVFIHVEAGTVLDQNSIQHAARWEGGRSWRILDPLVPNAVPCEKSLSVAMGTSGDGRVVVGSGWSARRSASDRTGTAPRLLTLGQADPRESLPHRS